MFLSFEKILKNLASYLNSYLLSKNKHKILSMKGASIFKKYYFFTIFLKNKIFEKRFKDPLPFFFNKKIHI